MCNILINSCLSLRMPESKSKPGMEFNKVQREVLRSGSKPEFRVAVGFRKWDAREVVEDVIVSALKTKN